MKNSTRLLLMLGVIELILFGIGLWLVEGLNNGTLQPATNTELTASSVMSTIGGVMLSLAAVVIIAVVVMRRKER